MLYNEYFWSGIVKFSNILQTKFSFHLWFSYEWKEKEVYEKEVYEKEVYETTFLTSYIS